MMTVAMDHNKNTKRKGSWDSKMSVSSTTVSSGGRRFKRAAGPSSILSSDSDIRFTRRKLGQQYRCGCFVVAGFLVALLLSAVAVYLGYTYLMPDPPDEQVFRARFRVIDGDVYSPEMSNPATDPFRIHARDYREKINLVFRRSPLRSSFVGTEVLALDGVEGQDLIVHFNLRFDPQYQEVSVKDLQNILTEEVSAKEPKHLVNVTIDPLSLEIKESSEMPTSSAPLTTSTESPITTVLPPPRRCQKVQLKYCQQLPYNMTSYPNFLGHRNIGEVQDNVIAFRELVDAECFRLAYDFVCQLLQPSCLVRQKEDELFLPCRRFCRDFWKGCGNRIPERYKQLLDCNNLPEYSGPGSCRVQPGCVNDLQEKALSPRVCDGVADCPDMTDETSCMYCMPGYLHCGKGRACIPRSKRCDGRKDCPDGNDEKACLGVAPSVELLTEFPPLTPHRRQFYSEGYVVFNEKGQSGKLCAEGLNTTGSEVLKSDTTLHTVAASLCRSLNYRKVDLARIQHDDEMNVSYVRMEDPMASEITFVRSSCPEKNVVYVGCSQLECGLQSANGDSAPYTLSKMSSLGDWPWHAALFRDDVHVCDGTLVSPDWILTTASCFQGQPKAEWVARLGVIRITSSSPWQQDRRVVGMVKSPVEGSTAVLIKLETTVILSDFVRPICIPDERTAGAMDSNFTNCNTLGWARNRDQLQRVQINVSPMERCENVSITTTNSLCTEPAYQKLDCNEEELAGSPMVCLQPEGKRWSLVGVSTWRIACAQDGTERPRMYDKITSNVAWIHKTVTAAP